MTHFGEADQVILSRSFFQFMCPSCALGPVRDPATHTCSVDLTDSFIQLSLTEVCARGYSAQGYTETGGLVSLRGILGLVS